MDHLAERLSQLSLAKRAALEQLLRASAAEGATRKIPRRAEADEGELSFAEQRLWFLDSLNPGHAFYNMPIAARLVGPLDIGALQQSLDRLIDRHESLRTTYHELHGEARRCVAPGQPLRLATIDLSNVPAAQRPPELSLRLAEEASRPFDLTRGPLLRASLFRLSAGEHVLLLAMHHIVADGWSMGVALADLVEFYEAARRGEMPDRRPLEVQYGDFAVWQRRQLTPDVVQRELAWWRQQLGDDLPTLELPADRPRSKLVSFAGAVRRRQLDERLTARLRDMAQREGATLFMVLLAAYNVLLSRWTRQSEFAVGTVVAGRSRSELEPLIGFFAHTLALRVDLSGEPTFRQLLARARQTTLDALNHVQLPFEKLVELLAPERHQNVAPVFQVALVVQNAPLAFPTTGGLRVEPLPLDNGTAKYDLTLLATERQYEIELAAEYRADLFDPATIDRLLDCLTTLLDRAAADPDLPVVRLPWLEPAARRHVLSLAEGEPLPPVQAETLHDLIARQVAAQGDHVAVIDGARSWTYAQMNHRADRLAARLRAAGVVPERPVAVCLPRSANAVVAALAVWRAGGVYVPLDPDQPAQRLAYVLDDTAASWLITHSELTKCVALVRGNGPQVLLVDDDEAAAELPQDSGPPVGIGGQNLAYILYTSGSTGRPKGVEIEHRSIVNFLRGFGRMLRLTPADRMLHLFAPSFDGALAEAFVALSHGATLVVADRETALNADRLEALIAQHRVSVAKFPPSLLQLLRPEALAGVRTIAAVGESLPADVVERWAPGRRLLNGYGPTETTVGVTMMEVAPQGDRPPPIGRPLPGVRVYVLDDRGEPVPLGVPGEIVVGGMGVGRGYRNLPEWTAERFLPDRFAGSAEARMYRTGDLGRWRSDGVLEFLGRLDDQVKIRGYRIEPGEVAAVLRQHPAVEQAAVVVDAPDGAAARLVAYVVPQRNAASDEEEEETQRLVEQHVGGWRGLFDELHRRSLPAADPTFDVTGWISSYNGQPIPAEQMRQWVDQTVAAILTLRPRRVLEIGCGTGLILFGVAAHCQRYVGIDLSDDSIGKLRVALENRPELAERVALHVAQADRLPLADEPPFDVVVLNSVVQYFPSVHYLLEVLDAAVARLAPGGTIFLGDIRSLPLQATLAAALERHAAPEPLDPHELVRRVRLRMEREEELLVDPELFRQLRRRYPRLGGVQVALKRGTFVNELTAYRYDVVLRFDVRDVVPAPRIIPWTSAAETLPQIEQALDGGAAAVLVRRVPNARLVADVARWESARQQATSGNSSAEAKVDDAAGHDPDWFYQLGDRFFYDTTATWSDSADDGTMDIHFVHRGAARWEPIRVADTAGLSDAVRRTTWNTFTNHPLAGAQFRRLIPRLRSVLEEHLPEYMVPAAFVLLDDLPRTTHGKLDRRALPPPPGDRPQWTGGYVAPRNEQEVLVTEVWQDLLGIRPVGIRDDFFQLGGHSMLAVQVMAEIERRSGRRLPLAALFQQATVEYLARLLADPQESPGASSLVPLAPGASQQPALYLVHPAGGTVFCYLPLAERLRERCAVYGLQAVGIDGRAVPHQTVGEMAAHYVSVIRQAQPEGPYHLAGWSLGGNLAFEMACQLAEQQQQVGLLGLLDSGAMQIDRSMAESDFLTLIVGLFPDQDHLPLEQLRQLAPQEQLHYFLQRAAQAGLALPGDDQAGQHVLEVFQANVKAMVDFRPRPYSGHVMLFRAEQEVAGFALTRDPALGWSTWCAGVEVVTVGGDHVHMVRPPYVDELAEALAQRLRATAPPH